jgi:hypothetical protein
MATMRLYSVLAFITMVCTAECECIVNVTVYRCCSIETLLLPCNPTSISMVVDVPAEDILLIQFVTEDFDIRMYADRLNM